MAEQTKIDCPDCEALDGVGRRDFMLAVGGTAVTLASLEAIPSLASAQARPQPGQPARNVKPAEALIRELYQGLTPAQRERVVYPWNHMITQQGAQIKARHGMFNGAIFPTHNIGAVYTPAQQELNQRIVRAICSDEEGHRRITRNGTWDASQSFERCGAYIFGNPANNEQYAWVFSGHHLTVRCDGNSEPGAAFGGPMYYGHTPDGYSQRNVFNYQTRSVQSVYEALTEAQRRQALLPANPGEHASSIQFRAQGQRHPGIAGSDLTPDQRRHVEQVMRDILSPYRREDADEVMDIVRRNGGMDRVHLGFYRDARTDATKWDFWRLEGPGFVWNFRVLPHVHTYVNIALAQPAAPAIPAPRG